MTSGDDTDRNEDSGAPIADFEAASLDEATTAANAHSEIPDAARES